MSGSEGRRNPYLVLGLPYGSSPKDATRAFVRRSRAIEQGTFVAYRITDLTWALQQVEQAAHEPKIDVTIYRVPANQSLLASPPGVGDGGGTGFFNPAPVAIGRATGPVESEEVDVLLDKAVVGWVGGLLGSAGEPVQLPYPFSE
jgi:hypothetical protein